MKAVENLENGNVRSGLVFEKSLEESLSRTEKCAEDFNSKERWFNRKGFLESVLIFPVPFFLETGQHSRSKQGRTVCRQIFHKLLLRKFNKSRVALAKEGVCKDRPSFRLSLLLVSSPRLPLETSEERYSFPIHSLKIGGSRQLRLLGTHVL